MFSNILKYANIKTDNLSNDILIPQTKRGYTTNNKYPEMPPLMNDGRSVTASWQPNATENNKIISDNNIKSNWEYRRYLTTNAKQIMNTNYNLASNDKGYNSRPIDLPNIQTDVISYKVKPPHLYKTTLDNLKPYDMSDLKVNYISNEEILAKQISPSIKIKTDNL